jgi:hypothetical protein
MTEDERIERKIFLWCFERLKRTPEMQDVKWLLKQIKKEMGLSFEMNLDDGK